MGFVKQYGPLVGRILIALLFLKSGWHKVSDFQGTAAAIGGQGLPLPEVLTALSILIELAGAAMIIVGFKARIAALVIFLWLIPVTVVFHAFWVDPAQMNNFLKNLGLMGAMLYIAAFGSGRYSVDRN